MSRFAPRAVLFDLDGTLLDTAPDLAAALNQVRTDLMLEPLPLERLRPVASQGARGLLRVGMDREPEDPDYEHHRLAFLEHYRRNIARHTRPFPGISALLKRLEAHRIAWGIVTNKPYALAEALIEALSLSTRCACLIGGDSAARAKPAPDPLQMAAEQLQLQTADCLYVGDDRRDIEAARACAMPVVAAAWGYIGDDENPADWQADAIARDAAALEALIEWSDGV